jgi:hypothetical protein
VGIGVWCSAQKKVVAFFDLLQSVGIVVSSVQCQQLQMPSNHSVESTYDVTGMSPQSMTLAQELKGFALSGTLYPPLNPTLREPLCSQGAKSKHLAG